LRASGCCLRTRDDIECTALVVPALAGWVDDVEDRLGGKKSHRGRSSGNSAADKVRRAVRNANKIDQEVLIGKVGGISSDKETCGSTDDGAQGRVVLGVVVGGFFDVLHESAENGAAGTESTVKCQSAADPGPGKDPAEAQLGSLQGVDEGLPRGSATESGGSEEDGRLEFSFQVDGLVLRDGLLGTVVEVVAGKNSDSVPDTGGQGEIEAVGGEAKVVLGDNR